MTISELDPVDLRILQMLEDDARTPIKLIAAEVGLAGSTTHERIKALRRAGVIRGTHADVDPRAFQIEIEALLMIELSKHKRASVDDFLAQIGEVPEVRSAFLVTGQFDVVVHLLVRNMQHLKNVALDRFTSHPDVVRVISSIVYEARHNFRSPAAGPN